MNCKWCGKPIEPRYSWGVKLWAHLGEGMYISQCLTVAEPEEDPENISHEVVQ